MAEKRRSEMRVWERVLSALPGRSEATPKVSDTNPR